jgi:hypothetical protein
MPVEIWWPGPAGDARHLGVLLFVLRAPTGGASHATLPSTKNKLGGALCRPLFTRSVHNHFLLIIYVHHFMLQSRHAMEQKIDQTQNAGT